ncbi:hypothetical protein IWQ60_006780, partial [Tieghemiomyces parasiticus]
KFIGTAKEANQTTGEVSQVDKGLYLKAMEFVRDGKVLIQKAEQVDKDCEEVAEAFVETLLHNGLFEQPRGYKATQLANMCSRLDEPRSRPYPLQPETDVGGIRFVQPGTVDDYKTIVDIIGVFWGAFLHLLLKILSDFRPELHRIQQAAHITKLRDNADPKLRTCLATNGYFDDSLANPFDWSVAVVFAALDKFVHLKLYYGL